MEAQKKSIFSFHSSDNMTDDRSFCLNMNETFKPRLGTKEGKKENFSFRQTKHGKNTQTYRNRQTRRPNGNTMLNFRIQVGPSVRRDLTFLLRDPRLQLVNEHFLRPIRIFFISCSVHSLVWDLSGTGSNDIINCDDGLFEPDIKKKIH